MLVNIDITQHGLGYGIPPEMILCISKSSEQCWTMLEMGEQSCRSLKYLPSSHWECSYRFNSACCRGVNTVSGMVWGECNLEEHWNANGQPATWAFAD